jgi:2-polyprenyl-3-methyl-5-hydroxy-6-metoxy-1,4-benzoquinol methylase
MNATVQTDSASSSDAAKRVLDVGCGWNKTPGAIGIDANPKTHADVIHDLGVLPYPFANDEFDEVVCRHVAEHVPDVMAFITELFRITRPGGRIKITTPHYSNPDWPTDPTHRNHFNSYSFNCFVEERQLFPFYTEVRLKPVRIYVSLANLWRAIGLELIVNLDQRWPGLRFTRKFWEFYLSFLFRGKELQFDFEVIKQVP